LLLVGLLIAWYVRPQMMSERDTVFSTAIGAIKSIPAPDGSRITLNTDSVIEVAMTPHERRVQLQRGEAFFEVAKDPRRPFKVTAGNKVITALGTAFSVRRTAGNSIDVVVTEGAVRVDEAGRDEGTANAAILRAGGIAHSTESGTLIEERALPRAQEQLSWRIGTLVFRNESLVDAIAEFNRYNTRQMFVEDPAIKALRIEGNFRATNLDGFVHVLEDGFGLHVEQVGNRIELSQK